MKRTLFIIGVFLGLCFISQESGATEAYVTDSFEVTLRTGPSTDNKIIAMPSSGRRVEVLETNESWSHVRLLDSGDNVKEGWIVSRFLITRVPWERQARSLKEQNARLIERLDDIKKGSTETFRREQELAAKLKETAAALGKVEKEYESLKKGASGYLKLKTAHEVARSTLETAQAEVKRLTAENKKMRSSQKIRWFATGAVVLLCGLMFGLVMGRQQKKRKSGYY